MTQHPFAGRKGSRFARAVKRDQYVKHNGACPMCDQLLAPDIYSNPLDHIRPYKLRPDLTYDSDNLRILCRTCHERRCSSIEGAHWPDDDMIAAAKARECERW